MDQVTMNKIGILIPQSNTFPLMGKSFVNGLKLALEGLACEYHIESIGLGADPKQLLNSFQKLSFQYGVSITTGLLGHYGLADLAHFASNNEDLLLIADLGAKKPIKMPPGVFQNSLGLYDSLRALVNYFETHNIQKLATSTCYYESGYDFIESLGSALEQTEKTAFAGHFITPLNPRENESELMDQTIKAIDPDAIVAFHNSLYAQEHATFLAENNIHTSYPIYSLPFSCEDNLIMKFPEVFAEINVLSTWFRELNNDANLTFIKNYEKAYHKTPDFFALLGYENGLIIRNGFDQEGSSLRSAIEKTNIQGPRGNIAFNSELNRTAYPHYLWEISPQNEQIPLKKIKKELGIPQLETSPDQSQEETRGWFNAYLCH